MTLDEARGVLELVIGPDGRSLDSLSPFVMWRPGQRGVMLDGTFGPRALEAMVIFVQEVQRGVG